jgi:hypothetical protein
MTARILISAAIAAAVFTGSSEAQAAPIQFRITGTIDVLRQVGPLPEGIAQDAPFEAILSYEPTTPDSQPNDEHRGYYSAVDEQNNFLLIQAGPSQIRSIHDLVLWVGNDVDQPQELWELPDDTFRMLDSELTANFEVSRIAFMVFAWNDPTRSVFNSDSLPSSLDASQFNQPFIEVRTFQIDPRVYQFTIHAVVESIEPIPEPTSFALTAVAIMSTVCSASVAFLRRKGRGSLVASQALSSQGGQNEDSKHMASTVRGRLESSWKLRKEAHRDVFSTTISV